jgi:hypothetical protein
MLRSVRRSHNAVAILTALVVAGAVVLVTFSQTASQPSPPPSGSPASAQQMTSSSTGLQSFLWILDGGGSKITFCFSTASPETGPQYDFSCRSRTIHESNVP